MQAPIIHSVHFSDPLFQRSIAFASDLYPAHGNYHSDIAHHYFISAWVISEEETILGRVVAYENPNLIHDESAKENQKVLLIGNYECVNRPEIAQQLIQAIIDFAAVHEYTKIIGPISGSTWDNYRFKTRSSRPFLGEAINQDYYANQWKSNGFKDIATYYSAMDGRLEFHNDSIVQREKELTKQGTTIRPIDINLFESELQKIHRFNQSAFSQNEFFTPISEEDFIAKYQRIKSLIDPYWVEMVEDVDHHLVGYIFAYEDRLDPSSETVVLKTVARSSKREYRGLGLVLARRLNEKAIKRGKKQIVHAYMHQKNASLHCSETMHGTSFAEYQLFELSLSPINPQ
jgi:hypothetical protein